MKRYKESLEMEKSKLSSSREKLNERKKQTFSPLDEYNNNHYQFASNKNLIRSQEFNIKE